jgi:hydroxypyruvate reductase
MDIEPRDLLSRLFQSAVEAADPYRAILRHLPKRPKGRTIVVGAGKAASQMASAFERAWGEPVIGIVVARHGPIANCKHISVLQAAHPVPDEAGVKGAEALLKLVQGLTEEDLVIALISGGGSSLLPCPPNGFSLEDEAGLNRALLASGAPISAMNVVRAHFSRIKAGRLAAAAHPARVVSLVVSDIPGDNPALVASGPTIPDTMSATDALKILGDYQIELPQAVIASITGAKVPDPTSKEFERNDVHVIASAARSLDAAAQAAEALGLKTVILSDAVEGEAKDIGLMHAAIAREISLKDRPFKKPVLLLSGGETTVDIRGGTVGKGGRNAEFLLSFALAIEGFDEIVALAADTDGIDGSENNAGAFCDGTTANRLRRSGQDGRRFLLAHDAYSAFERIGDLFVPGPTGTNVNDFRAILIGP